MVFLTNLAALKLWRDELLLVLYSRKGQHIGEQTPSSMGCAPGGAAPSPQPLRMGQALQVPPSLTHPVPALPWLNSVLEQQNSVLPEKKNLGKLGSFFSENLLKRFYPWWEVPVQVGICYRINHSLTLWTVTVNMVIAGEHLETALTFLSTDLLGLMCCFCADLCLVYKQTSGLVCCFFFFSSLPAYKISLGDGQGRNKHNKLNNWY